MTLVDLQKFAPDADKDFKGRPWFAWRPVRTINGWRWFCFVRRCVDTGGPDAGKPYFREL
jgi:hypothetical protein